MPVQVHPDRTFDLIIADIDGCLTPEGPEPFDVAHLARIAAHNERAFAAAEAHAPRLPPITLCSGRPQPFAEAMCRLIHNTTIPCICENGVWLYHPGTNEYMMDPAITPEHIAAVHEVEAWVRRELFPRGVSIQPGKAASISLYHPDPDYLRREVRPLVERTIGARGDDWPLRISMTWFYINCDLKHISKSTGLDRLAAHIDVPRERLAGIGDTPSDLAIRDRVGFFACPANAHEEVKRAADFIAPSPQAAGVLEILEHLSP